MQFDTKIILALIPLILIQFALVIICILDWFKRKNFRGMNRWIWLVIIVCISFIGPVLYLTVGKGHGDN